MRRSYKARGDALTKSSDGEQGFWPSYADMMSALALILFFLMLLSYIQNLVTGNNLQSTQDDLELTRNQLAITLHQVEDAESDLAKITIDLDEARLTLSERETALSEKEEEIAAMDQLLSDQLALIGEQEKYLLAANDELRDMRAQMQTIAVLRLSILEQIRDSVADVMGDASRVSIGSNGNIILSESILFDNASAVVKPEAAPALDQLINVFAKFLADDDNAKYVDSIVIAGHTDSVGSESLNRALSTDRANAVLDYLLENDQGKLDKYEQYFCAAGYGKTRPVADNSTPEGRAANRRIEISIILRDDSVMDIVDNYLDIELPEVPETPTPTPATRSRR